MVETHTRILGIAPYDGMRTAMEQAAQAYPNVELEVYTGDLEEGQAIVQRMAPNSYDCIISRGGTATLIRQVTDLPVVDIHISVYDVLRTMKLAENYTSLYAIVGFPSITEPAHTLCSLLNFDLDILTVRSAEEVRHTLERLKQGGYRMVVCDMVTHTIAREMGFDAFLITSGIESLHSAIDQAVNISTWFGQLRQENLFLRSITQEQGGRVVVMEPDGSLYYNNMKDISPELHRCLQTHLREIPATGSLKFYYTERSQLYSITAQVLLMNNVQRYLFYCVPSRIPLHSNRPGLRSLNKGECEYLFSNSFYSLSGAMGTQDAEINAQINGIENATFVAADAGSEFARMARRGEELDVVFMDPPRAGSSQAFLANLSRLGPRRVVYISCDPKTQIRDIKHLVHNGYRIKRICPVDMFPHTDHVENVVLLERAPRKQFGHRRNSHKNERGGKR